MTDLRDMDDNAFEALVARLVLGDAELERLRKLVRESFVLGWDSACERVAESVRALHESDPHGYHAELLNATTDSCLQCRSK